MKPKFLELGELKIQIFVKENPVVASENICCICGFLLDTEACGKHERWYYFIVEREYLFIRNIYSKNELEKNGKHKKY